MKINRIAFLIYICLIGCHQLHGMASEQQTARERAQEREHARYKQEAHRAVHGLQQPGQTAQEKREARSSVMIHPTGSHAGQKTFGMHAKMEKHPAKISRETRTTDIDEDDMEDDIDAQEIEELE